MFELKKIRNFPASFCIVFILMLVMGSFPGTAFSQGTKKIKTIIIDPGHGGKYTGAVGEYEGSLHSKEKDIVLAISMKLVADLKEAMPDVDIIPTRTSDVSMDVHEKAKFANDHHGDLFVSIHADAVTLPTHYRIVGYKTEPYYTHKYIGKGKSRKRIRVKHTHKVPIKQYYKLPTSRKGTSTLILAARQGIDKAKALESSDMQFITEDEDSTLNINYNSPEYKASALLYSAKYFRKSYMMAKAVQQEIADMGRENLGVWQREIGLWVLHATQMPAILIETGFIANYDDERYLNSEKGQEEIAQAITRALVKYKNQVESPQTINGNDSVGTAPQ